ncbi:ligand-gated sodium channel [Desmophyllum pertusum]|uniref:Ligand-gated sodium channel n=1 Tax=Desmophyllum pertusum TaxID=174260 RepID=A0A9X0D3D6_9CNID|nr:ligand-gated sodium channel [Desmophyllum pertusum]
MEYFGVNAIPHKLIFKMNNLENKLTQDTSTTKQNYFSDHELKDGDSTLQKLKDFCGYTTAHGFGRLVESKSWVRKVFWVLACLGAFTMFTCQVIWLAEDYIRRPVVTYINIEHVRDIDYPVVTICNHNIIRRSKIFSNNSGILQQSLADFLNNMKNTTKQVISINIRKYTPYVINKVQTEDHQEKENAKIDIEKNNNNRASGKKKKKAEKDNLEESPMTDMAAKQERVRVTLATWPEEDLSKLGHQFKNMFRESRIAIGIAFGITCMGNCFSFNKERGLRAGGPGPGNGLLLEINVEQNEYNGELTKDAGIRVHIGKPGKVPFPYEKGFSVGPGSATSVGMKMVKIKRVDPFKNGSCMGQDGLKQDNLYRLKYNASYSTTACKESCLSDKQKDLCGCREYRFPKDASKNESVCDVTNATVAKCLHGVMKKYRKSHLGCSRKCPSPCDEDVFKLTISTSRFPSLAYEKIIRADSNRLKKANIPRDKISSYLLQLNVFFEELNYEVIEENLGYELISFISDIGGNVGMWIGVSLLTCAEILELLCIIIHHTIKKFAQYKNKIMPMKK